MKIYLISSNPTERIEFKVDNKRYALVHNKTLTDEVSGVAVPHIDVITLNKKELLTLYQIIQKEFPKEE